MRNRPLLLLTRPAAQSARMAAMAREQFGAKLDILEAPLARVVPRPFSAVAVDTSLIATSENAVHTAAEGGVDFTDRITWCVGPRTAQAARLRGANVRTGAGDAAALAAMIDVSPLCWLRGVDAAFDIAKSLNERGLDTDIRITYAINPLDFATNDRQSIAQAPQVIAPVMSVRSAKRLAQALGPDLSHVQIAAISQQVADAWPHPKTRCAVAQLPTADAVLNAIHGLLP